MGNEFCWGKSYHVLWHERMSNSLPGQSKARAYYSHVSLQSGDATARTSSVLSKYSFSYRYALSVVRPLTANIATKNRTVILFLFQMLITVEDVVIHYNVYLCAIHNDAWMLSAWSSRPLERPCPGSPFNWFLRLQFSLGSPLGLHWILL